MSNDIERIEPQRSQDEIILLRPAREDRQPTLASNAWSPWALFGVIVAAIVVGNIVWWWSAKIYAEHELTVAAEQLAKQAKEEEKVNRQLYYKELANAEIAAQRQEAENARIAWENYNQERARQDEEAQRQFILAQQHQWQSLNTKNTSVSMGVKTNQTPEEVQADNCKAWINSNIVDPTPDKKRYIKENC